ncbi:hypothetical protein DTO166G4_2291 [Paecilomyces variotii]|nr:hypothetical protein DTO166G4_2291 [Paecilomyces variotii]KAJ9240756.1 hypothetical protein DTO166G5_1565 [Paecilomyces variotii]
MGSTLSSQPKWLVLAIASGTFAALNGLFAKLTTTELTTSISLSISHFLHLPDEFVEVVVRAICFALNLISNFIMWALFTRALTASQSTTKVSITNTSANFFVTALLGMIVFSEKVRGLWWVGAAMMGAGCILVGMRDESGKEDTTAADATGRRTARLSEDGVEGENVALLGGDEDLSDVEEEGESGKREGRRDNGVVRL